MPFTPVGVRQPSRDSFVGRPARHTPAVAAPGTVSFVAVDLPIRVTCRLNGVPQVTGGYGGWTEKERPQKLPITQWDGAPLYRLSVPIIFDRWRQGQSVEVDIGILERLGRDPGGDAPPPILNVELPAGAPRSPSVPLVVEDIDWSVDDSDELRLPSGERARQAGTVTLMQYVADDQVKLKSVAKKRKKGSSRTYTVKRGDTLAKIAKKFGISDWHKIAKLNNVRDPQHLKVGQKLRLP